MGEVRAVNPVNGHLTVRLPEGPGSDTLVCTPAEFAHDWELTGKRARGLGPYRLTMILLFILAICFYIWSKISAAALIFPSSVASHSTAIVNGKPELEVTLKLKDKGAGMNDLDSTIGDMKTVLKDEDRRAFGEESVNFHIVRVAGGGYDDYGNSIPTRTIPAFDIRYSANIIRRINWEHMDELKLINLGTVSQIFQTGTSIARDFCTSYRDSARAFCAKFEQGL